MHEPPASCQAKTWGIQRISPEHQSCPLHRNRIQGDFFLLEFRGVPGSARFHSLFDVPRLLLHLPGDRLHISFYANDGLP
jgi:hypothetical protein